MSLASELIALSGRGFQGLFILVFLLALYFWLLRYAVVFTIFFNRYKVFTLIGIWGTILLIWKSTPELLRAQHFCQMRQALLDMLKKAIGE
jgi:hypothetical protein